MTDGTINHAAVAPKAFISYSWSSPTHCDVIRSYAERLRGDGIDVVLDQWDLSEGQDKYAFMEKMVTDASVTHVLVFSDKRYVEKADARKAGVGTESQIMSKEIYDKVDQKKFIPLICERREDGEPHLPAFLRARIAIDFSTPEQVNDNWEQLIRALYGKPLHTKPVLGNPPSYISTNDAILSLPTIGKFAVLRDSVLNGKPAASLNRADFLDVALQFLDSFRPRARPEIEHFDEKIIDDLRTLLPLRDQFIDWIALEEASTSDAAFEETLTDVLERLLALRYKPAEVMSWNDWWFDALRIFVYEVFLYAIATLIRSNRFVLVRSLLTTHYLLPETEHRGNQPFVRFDDFYGYSEVLYGRNQRLKLNRISLVADVIKERSTRRDVSFRDVMQAELVLFLAATIAQLRWYPQTLVYAGYGSGFPLFIRAAQHKHFEKLKTAFAVTSADELRKRFKEGYEKLGVNRWFTFRWHTDVSFWDAMNMDALDTID